MYPKCRTPAHFKELLISGDIHTLTAAQILSIQDLDTCQIYHHLSEELSASESPIATTDIEYSSLEIDNHAETHFFAKNFLPFISTHRYVLLPVFSPLTTDQ